MKKSIFDRFDTNWKFAPYTTEGVKFIIRPIGGEAAREFLPVGEDNFRARFNGCVNDIMRLLHSQYLAGDIGRKDLMATGKHNPAGKVMKECDHIFAEYGITYGTIKEQIAHKAMQILLSYIGRNDNSLKKARDAKKKKKMEQKLRQAPKLRNSRTISFRRGTVRDCNPDENKGTLRFTIGLKQYVTADYFIPHRQHDIKKYVKEKCSLGGNLTCRKGVGHFLASVRMPFQWKYQPVGVIGTDINKAGKWFIVMSDGHVISVPPEIAAVSKEIRDCNKAINALRKESAQLCELRRGRKPGSPMYPEKGAGKRIRNRRRRLRLTWKALHRKMERCAASVVNELLDVTERQQALLCIDYVTTGQANGTWGQGAVIKLLVAGCESRGIPFVLVPPKYTTVIHANCGEVGHRKEKPNGKKDHSIGVCPIHGEYQAHLNAAENAAFFGWMMWQDGYQTYKKWIQPYLPEKAAA